MSAHWAFLDNFYVIPASRDLQAGKTLFQELVTILKARNVAYLSTLVRQEDSRLRLLCEHFGLEMQSTYIWLEHFLA